MSDTASGSISGFLFQFEKALALLVSSTDPNAVVSIEKVDDVAVENEDSIVLVAVQQKHSISPNGTVFGDTSYALWRTIQIWIQKIQSSSFGDDTIFICSTNKKIESDSLLSRIRDNEFDAVILEVAKLLKSQKAKLKEIVSKGENGTTIKQVNGLIQFALNNPDEFKIVIKNIQINDEENLKDTFLSEAHLITDEYSDLQRNNIYESLFGWISKGSLDRWRNGATASFNKTAFNTKLKYTTTNPTITNAIFVEKSKLGTIPTDQQQAVMNELFVTQIQDIRRNSSAQERKIKNAILDYLYHDIEVARIIEIGNYTEADFDEFKELCFKKWQDHYDTHVLKELVEYSPEDMNDIAIKMFDTIMNNIVLDFKNGITFNSQNQYIHNGAFLKLSNIPKIGWLPDWESKYLS